MTKRGLFITFEGVEGAGKSTLSLNVSKALQADSIPVTLTREPGGTLLGEKLRLFVLDKDLSGHIKPRAELFLFLAARAQHVEEVIRPRLLEGVTVLCDRFSDSTVAYQGYGRHLGPDYVQNLCDLSTGFLIPDLTFLCDLETEQGFLRTNHRKSKDRIEEEHIEFHKQVRKGFLELSRLHPDRIVILDAMKSAQDLLSQCLVCIDQKRKNYDL